ncbi:hypothetical protein DZF96_02915 [Clavibacter michiganensis]|uniref:Uncharacterized protein n=1 Tax=Clavibacter michiganensis TaxID=28447 RepID=A0A399NW70_9MICO|nr:hypothetical protein DZF96_02915 [Clavibacter michiganensis]
MVLLMLGGAIPDAGPRCRLVDRHVKETAEAPGSSRTSSVPPGGSGRGSLGGHLAASGVRIPARARARPRDRPGHGTGQGTDPAARVAGRPDDGRTDAVHPA